MMKKYLFFFWLASVASGAALCVLLASTANGALLSVNKDGLMLDTQGASVNAVEIHLSFATNSFSVKDLNDGRSLIEFWARQPSFSNESGTIDLAGIVPGGIQTANGAILRWTLTPKQGMTMGSFIVASATVLLNDGQGTAAPLTVKNAPFAFTQENLTPTTTTDTQAPDPFLPKISRDPNLFSGKYFLVFSTTDQNSGIDHYEVMEVSTKSTQSTGWQRAASPYVLADQTLTSNIYVRAVDGAGNFRVVEVPAQVPVATSGETGWLWLLGGFGIIVVGILWRAWRKKRS